MTLKDPTLWKKAALNNIKNLTHCRIINKMTTYIRITRKGNSFNMQKINKSFIMNVTSNHEGNLPSLIPA